MKGYIELKALTENVPEIIEVRCLIAVEDIISVLDAEALPEGIQAILPAPGTKTLIALRTNESTMPTSATYNEVRDLIRACVGV